MTSSTEPGNGPSPSRRNRRIRVSGTAVLLAGGTSAAVVYAGVVGAFTAPLAVAAACGACVIAYISVRHSRPLADLLPPLAEGSTGPVVIDAPRASGASGGAGHIDAA